jgi:hypothetical protein
MGFLEVFLFMVIMVLAGRQGISDFGSEGWGFPACRQTGNPAEVTNKKLQWDSLRFFCLWLLWYLPVGREYQISALRVWGFPACRQTGTPSKVTKKSKDIFFGFFV